MPTAELDQIQTGLLDEVQGLSGGITAWNVPLLTDDSFHAITAKPPAGFLSVGKWGTAIWYEPASGGAAIIFNRAAEHHEPLGPDTVSGRDIDLSCLRASPMVPSEAPGVDPKEDSKHYKVKALLKHLGLLVLAHVPDELTIIQLPGADDYAAAYAAVNGEPPLIRPDMRITERVKPKKLFEMLAGSKEEEEGRWPGDGHFFEDHALTFIAGGATFARRVIAMTRQSLAEAEGKPERLLKNPNSELDGATNTLSLIGAAARLKIYQQTGDTALLFPQPLVDCTLLADGQPLKNRAVQAQFNTFMAGYMGVALPEQLAA